MEKIILVGCGGHAKSVVDSIEGQGKFEIAGFIAEKLDSDFEYRGYKIIGTDVDLESLYAKGIHNAFICIGYMGKENGRSKIYEQIKNIGYKLPVIIDKTAIVATDALIGEGTFVGKRAVINSNARIGVMTIINTGAIVEHDSNIDDYTHIAVNATICGGAQIGKRCLVGAGATVIQGVVIKDNAIIGAGSAVVKDVAKNNLVLGIPAKTIKKIF